MSSEYPVGHRVVGATMKIGYKLFAEALGPKELVRQAVEAERAGFDFVEVSDHFHPWLHNHGHSGFVWSMLAAMAERTESARAGDGRHLPDHPLPPRDRRPGRRDHGRSSATAGSRSASARASSSTSTSSGVAGPPRSPPRDAARGARDHPPALVGRLPLLRGQAPHARATPGCSTCPTRCRRSPSRSAAREAREIAAELGDGIFATDPDADLVEAYSDGGRRRREVRGGAARVGARRSEAAAESAHELFRFGLLGWGCSPSCRTRPTSRRRPSSSRVDDVREAFACGPDPQRHLEVAQGVRRRRASTTSRSSTPAPTPTASSSSSRTS